MLSDASQVTSNSSYSGIEKPVDGESTVICGGVVSKIEKTSEVSESDKLTISWVIILIRQTSDTTLGATQE